MNISILLLVIEKSTSISVQKRDLTVNYTNKFNLIVSLFENYERSDKSLVGLASCH